MFKGVNEAMASFVCLLACLFACFVTVSILVKTAAVSRSHRLIWKLPQITLSEFDRRRDPWEPHKSGGRYICFPGL